jgi:hypothetical protein
MAEYFWKLRGPDGDDLGESEHFDAQDGAEAWMGAHWSRLLKEGVDAVQLARGGEVLYDMSLHEA